MVSYINNGGLKFNFNENNYALNPYQTYIPYDYFHYTPGYLGYQPNLMYSQNSMPIEQKKTKKTKKKTSNEKNQKEEVPIACYKKEDLIFWLKSLSLEERFQVFSIKDSWLAVAFGRMYKIWQGTHDQIFALLGDENKLSSTEKNFLDGDLEKHFYLRKKGAVSLSEKQQAIDKAEQDLVQSVKIFDDMDFYDTVTIQEDLLFDLEKVIELFETISEREVFKQPCKISTDHNTKNTNVESPLWFNANSFQTLGAWVVYSFEKNIQGKFQQSKKVAVKNSSAFEILDFKMTLDYKKSLIDFWKGIESNRKEKLFAAANEIYKFLSSDNFQENPSDGRKEVNKNMKDYYQSSLFAEAKLSTTAESVNEYFKNLFEKNERVVIETIIMTSLDDFGKIPNLICRKLCHKLRNMLSEKIASDLILNEEREKQNDGHNNASKKKASKKKKAKKNNQNEAHPVVANETLAKPESEVHTQPHVDPVVTSNKSATKQQGEKHKEEAHNEIPEIVIMGSNNNNNTKEGGVIDVIVDSKDQKEEEIVYGREENKSNQQDIQIRDLESQMYSVFQAKFQRFAKDPKQLTKVPPRPQPLNFPGKELEVKHNEIMKMDEEKEHKTRESSQEIITLDSIKPQIDDAWTLFEDLDKKLSKSQKKKQKRKTRRQAEQNLLKAQAQEQELEQEHEEEQNHEEEEVQEEEKVEVKVIKEVEMKEMKREVKQEETKKEEKKEKENAKEEKELIKINKEEEPQSQSQGKELKNQASSKKKKQNNNKIELNKKEKEEIKEDIIQASETASNSSRSLSRMNSESSQTSKVVINNNNTNKKKPQTQKEKVATPTESTSSRKLSFQKESWKEDSSVRSSTTVSVAPTDFDETGFIEVKAKKKPEKEKETKPKKKKDGKEGWRRKEEKTAVAKAETKKPKSPARTRHAADSKKEKEKEKEKEHVENIQKSTNNAGKTCVITEKAIVDNKDKDKEKQQKGNVGIPKVFVAPQNNNEKKATVPKSNKKSITTPVCGSSSSSENEATSCTSKTTSQTSSSSHSQNINNNHGNNNNGHQSQKKSSPQTNNSSHKNDNNNQVNQNQKGSKNYHPLSLASPSLDLETMKISKSKEFANQFFNKKFEKDIYKHVAQLTEQSNKIMNYRILAYRRLDYCISKLFPTWNIKTKIYGSCATGLALNSSDVDIAVSGIEAYDRSQLCDSLLNISGFLRQFKWITSNKPIVTASVPILKLEIDPQLNFAEVNDKGQNDKNNWAAPDTKDKLDVDDNVDLAGLKINVDLSLEPMGLGGYVAHVGYKTTDFVQKMLLKYESLYIVTMVLKEFLNNRSYLNAYQGGISSYCLVIMIVALFQKFGDEGYMASLWRFFNFYGEIFQPESMGITLLESDPYFPLNHSYEIAPLWVIEHSTFQRKNIGGGSYLIKMILHEFGTVSKTIEFFRKKLEDVALKNVDLINSAEDIEKMEKDQELKEITNSNILELFIGKAQF